MTAAGLFAMTRLFATKWAWAASPLLLTVGLLAFPALVRAQTAPLAVGTTSLPNTDVTVTHDFDSLDAAHAFVGSEELRAAMQQAGVTAEPSVWFAARA